VSHADADRPESLQKIGAAILAAGASKRMGLNKSLLLVGGKPMLTRVIDLFHDHALAIDPIIVVTGHDADAIRSIVAPARPSSSQRESSRRGDCSHPQKLQGKR